MDRRRAIRRVLGSNEPLSRAKLRIGGELIVIDASNWGVLAETRERLLPGRHLDVHIVTVGGRVLVRVRVARAYVWQVCPDALWYRAALAFEQPIDARACGHPSAALLVSLPTLADRAYAPRARDGDIEFTEPLSA